MKKHARLAYNELRRLGAPVMEESWGGHGHFRISGEHNHAGTFGGNEVKDELWADYYELVSLDNNCGYQFGVHPKIIAILEKHGLYCEWQNAGVLDVYDA